MTDEELTAKLARQRAVIADWRAHNRAERLAREAEAEAKEARAEFWRRVESKRGKVTPIRRQA